MNFLLFIPDAQPAQLDEVARTAGFASLLDGHSVAPNMPGPNEQTGLVIGWTSPTSPLLHYKAEQQTWMPSICKDEDGNPRYWAGTWNDKPPEENEMRRPYTQAGPLVELGGNRWKMPTPDSVDARAVYADDGTMRWEVVRQFAWVCDEAEQLRATYLEEFGVRQMVFNVDPTAQIGWLLKLLQINYRIVPEIAVALDLWVGRERILDLFLLTLGMERKAAE